MAKIFLSHSSKDKLNYVRLVADRLIKNFGYTEVHYDEYTFEAGMKPLEEIMNGLNHSDIFVLFISKDSLKSDWVKVELNESLKKLDEIKLKKIYPIIIEEGIHYEDEDIPKWLLDYNLKIVKRPTKAVSLINSRIIEMDWQLHPRIKEKNEIFVGRNDLISKFEERYYDLDKEKPLVYLASGMESIGRRTLLKKCLIKTNMLRESYYPSVINISSQESIEDFILKLYDLGYGKKIMIEKLGLETLDNKIKIAIEIIKEIQEDKDTIFINDIGGIVSYDGQIKEWFLNVLESIDSTGSAIFGIITKFRVSMNNLWRNYKIYIVEVPELNKMERSGLLQRYLGFEKINLLNDDLNKLLSCQSGYPEQIYFSVNMIKEEGLTYTKEHISEIIDYNTEKIIKIMNKYEKVPETKEFLIFISQFDSISFKLMNDIVDNISFVNENIKEFYINGIIEFVGHSKEYIRVNNTVRDYLLRTDIKFSNKYETNMKIHLEDFLKNHEYEEIEIPDYFFSIKELLKSGKSLDKELLIPSHYLKTMIELYEKKRDYLQVIKLAETALERENLMDKTIVHEIRYFLCLALAKKRDKKMMTEVQKINGADHNFLKAYYYRMITKYDKALEELFKSLEIRSNFSKAKRELVQIYLNLEEYDKARELAKLHYENDKTNPYHIHAYFTCIIKDEKSKENETILQELLKNFIKVQTIQGKEMYNRSRALYLTIYENNEEEGLAIIENEIENNDYKLYPLITKFDICERTKNLEEMKKVLESLKLINEENDLKVNKNLLIKFEAIILAFQGFKDRALKLVEANKKSIDEITYKKIVLKINKY